jgi:hypothetical protein
MYVMATPFIRKEKRAKNEKKKKKVPTATTPALCQTSRVHVKINRFFKRKRKFK